mgnify:CR=1 FL=1
MEKLKLMTILGTRPEIIRLSATIQCCDRYFQQILVHTGQNYDYELNQVFFEDLGLRAPDYYLNAAGANLGETIGTIIAKSYALMQKVRPDAVLVLGDTNSCLSVIAAKRLHIPIFHMEAGNRCFDECLPEETNRRIVDIISDVNLCYSEHARRYLMECGMPKERTFVVGSPMAEVLHQNLPQIESSDIHARLGLEKGKYILLSAHREENIDLEDNFFSLMNAINHMAETYQVPVIYSTHPRSRKFIEQRHFQFHPLVRSLPPFGLFDYNHLQMNSLVVLSDSGTLSEESAMLGFCGVLIRTSTERPEVLDKGTVVIGGITQESVQQAAELAIAMQAAGEPRAMPMDYEDVNVGAKVVKLIQSYTPIVNETVWLKR